MEKTAADLCYKQRCDSGVTVAETDDQPHEGAIMQEGTIGEIRLFAGNFAPLY